MSTGTAPRLGELGGPGGEPLKRWQRNLDAIPFTPALNVSGQPGISLPLHWSKGGLPVGVHIVPPYGREDVLIRIAAQLEKAQPWAKRRPPVAGSSEGGIATVVVSGISSPQSRFPCGFCARVCTYILLGPKP